MGSENDASLHDLVIPVLLQSADGYKPMLARKKFEAISRVLAVQAYWLAWFEALKKMDDKLEGVAFHAGRRKHIQAPAWRAGSAPTPRDHASFEQARKRALSKLYGKCAPGERDLVATSLGQGQNFERVVMPCDEDELIGAAIGPQLAGLRMSRMELSMLESLLWEAPVAPSAPSGVKNRL